MAGGDYQVSLSGQSDCYYGFDLDNADTGRTEESFASLNGPASTATNIYAVPQGRYFIDVITGPSPDCPWIVRIDG